MADNAKTGIVQLAVSLSLDGRPVEIPAHLHEPLMAIRTHLQLAALRLNRSLAAFSVDAASVTLHSAPPSPASPGRLDLPSARFARDARRHIERFTARSEDLVLLVLVNDWTVSDRLWLDIQPDLRGVLVALNLWQEMLADNPAAPVAEGLPLLAHLAGWQELWTELNDNRTRKDAVGFSNALEQRLVPWLRELDAILAGLETVDGLPPADDPMPDPPET
ncbi:MAG TPA: hypothetical protein VHH73_13675 [Verrucomicrobiae bacterium]|nr:hypothetical protein [Verrucomicrobiae bacterium]